MKRHEHPDITSAIIEASLEFVATYGLTGWTIEDVAKRAGCAKGLVLYHFGAKERLLLVMASTLRVRCHVGWLAALDHAPVEAIGALWDRLAAEVVEGTCGLRLTLLGDPRTRAAMATTDPERRALAEAVARTFGLDSADPVVAAVPSALTGFQVQLLEGVPAAEVREGFDAWWLELLHRSAQGPM